MKEMIRWVDSAGVNIYLSIAIADNLVIHGKGIVVDFNFPLSKDEQALLRMLHPDKQRIVDFLCSIPSEDYVNWKEGAGLDRSRQGVVYRCYNPATEELSEWR